MRLGGPGLVLGLFELAEAACVGDGGVRRLGPLEAVAPVPGLCFVEVGRVVGALEVALRVGRVEDVEDVGHVGDVARVGERGSEARLRGEAAKYAKTIVDDINKSANMWFASSYLSGSMASKSLTC